MAAQRIVLTSPWKLGLFVFLLVAGTGFGLIYAYIEFLGGEFDLNDPEVLRTAYIVLGAIAGLALLAYLAVVTSARPLDRVVRGSRRREQLMKRFGGIENPRSIDPSEFDDEPALARVLERWAEEATRSSDVRMNSAVQSEALARLTEQLRESEAGEFRPELQDSTPDLDALVEAIQGIAATVPAPAEDTAARDEAMAARAEWESERTLWHESAVALMKCEEELEGFIESISERASEVARRTTELSQSDGASTSDKSMTLEAARRNGGRLAKIREAAELLAEEANKVAINLGLHTSRAGEAAHDLEVVSKELRTLCGQYQRIAAELRLVESESADVLRTFGASESAGLDSSTADALHQQAMALDQNAEALTEMFARFRVPIQKMRGLAPEAAEAAAPAPATPAVPAAPVAPAAPAMAQAPAEPASREERVYEIAELGGREYVAEAAQGGSGTPVHDLDEFGAVEL